MATQKYGLDLGSGTIKIYKDGQGIVLAEKNMIAIRRKKELVAFGDAAYEMYERTPDTIRVYSPVNHGVIEGLHDAQILLDEFLKKSKCANGFIRTNVFYFTVPCAITEVEKRAFFDLALNSEFRTKDSYIIEKPIAVAVGENINIKESTGVMIIDIGASTTEISVIGHGGLITSRLLKSGGNRIDEAIIEKVKDKYDLLIGMKTAEYLKMHLASLRPETSGHRKILGRDLITGLPSDAIVSCQDIYEVLVPFFNDNIETVRTLFGCIPPNIYRSILRNGIILTGGSSQIEYAQAYLSKAVQVEIIMSEYPLESSVRGLDRIMSEDMYSHLAFSVKEAIFS